MPYYFTSNVRLYQGTIRFNIVLGAYHDPSQEEIDQAAKNANVLTHLSSVIDIDLRFHSESSLWI